jgi:hypothetical protein
MLDGKKRGLAVAEQRGWLEGRKREVDKDALGSDHDSQLGDHGSPIRLTMREIEQPMLKRS